MCEPSSISTSHDVATWPTLEHEPTAGQSAACRCQVRSGCLWIATGYTDMRRGMNSLALQVQEGLKRDPHATICSFFVGVGVL
jgi:hypothetical protein